MSADKHSRGLKIGWLGGYAGATLWMLLLGIVRFAQGWNYRGLLWTACFLICAGITRQFLPWRRPETELRRLYFVSVTPIVVTVLLMLFLNVALESSMLWSVIPGILVLYLPVFTLGKKTWIDIAGGPGAEDA
jgi:hypothetical protein